MRFFYSIFVIVIYWCLQITCAPQKVTKPYQDVNVTTSLVNQSGNYNELGQSESYDQLGNLGDGYDDMMDGEQDWFTTEKTVSYYVLACILIGLAVLAPIILVPLLFVFVHRTSTTPEEEFKQARKQYEEIMNPTVHGLVYPITMVPTMPEQPLMFPKYFPEQKYVLSSDDSLFDVQTGLILHMLSGLAFVPINGVRFEPKDKTCVNKDESKSAPQANQLYDDESKQVYELCLGIAFDLRTMQFSLPYTSQVEPQQSDQSPPHRIFPVELPSIFTVHYNELLRTELPELYNELKDKQLVQCKVEPEPFTYAISIDDDQSVYLDAVSRFSDSPV